MKVVKRGCSYLALPEGLSRRIKGIVNDSEGSYGSVAEFVRDAVREKIERLEGMRTSNNKA